MKKALFTAGLDSLVAVILLITAHYLPADADFIKSVVLAIQPFAAAMVLYFFGDEAKTTIVAAIKSLK